MEILKYGSRGPEVELLQAGLNRAGFYVGNPDGIFGKKTLQVLQLFQQSKGLTADGIFDPSTYLAMFPYYVGYIDYQIMPGDTIHSLSNTYNVSTKAIETANPEMDPDRLYIGQNLVIPLPFPVVFTNISFTYNILNLCLEGLIKRYPFLSIGNIGSSVLKKKLRYVCIGEGDNEVIYNASHHANEWITTPVLMKFLEDYSYSYSNNGEIYNIKASDIYKKTTIYIIPMVNPDGVDLVTGAIKVNTAEYEYAKSINFPKVKFPSGWKANILGTDLNLNYPAEWEKAKEVKYSQGYTTPGPRDYVGPNPLSEPESQAMALLTNEHNFRLSLSYHTQGKVIYWKFLDYLPQNSYEIALKFGEVSGYDIENTPIKSGYAGYKDWFIQTYNLPGYTIEVGLGVNPLPISQFEEIYKDNIGILVLAAIQ